MVQRCRTFTEQENLDHSSLAEPAENVAVNEA